MLACISVNIYCTEIQNYFLSCSYGGKFSVNGCCFEVSPRCNLQGYHRFLERVKVPAYPKGKKRSQNSQKRSQQKEKSETASRISYRSTKPWIRTMIRKSTTLKPDTPNPSLLQRPFYINAPPPHRCLVSAIHKSAIVLSVA